MNIAFCNRYTGWGGGEKWHSTMADFMTAKGHNVYIFCTKDGEIYTRALQNPKITPIPIVITKHSYWNPLYQLKLYMTLKKLNLDAIIINDIIEVRTIARAAKLAGVKNVVYRNGRPLLIPLKKSFVDVFNRAVNKIVALSNDSKELLKKNSGLKNLETKISLIANTFDFEKLPVKNEVSPIPKKEGEVVIVTTGRLAEEKGQSYLIMAAQILKQKNLNFKIWLVGEGELEEELRTLAKALDVEDKIEFIGFKQDVYPYLYHADIFAFPSYWEGLSNSIIEAQAIGLPCVCFNVSSMKELVFEGVNGLLSRPKDEIDFANKMALLIINKEQRLTFGDKAKTLIKENYDREKIIKKWEELLRN